MIINLVFKDKQNNKSPINLIFGDNGGAPVESINEITANIQLYDFSLFGRISVDYGINENLIYESFNSKYGQSVLSFKSYLINFNESAKLAIYSPVLFSNSSVLHWLYRIEWNNFEKLNNTSNANWRHNKNSFGISYFIKWGDTLKQFINVNLNWQIPVNEYKSAGTYWGDGSVIEQNIQSITFKKSELITKFNTVAKWGLGGNLDQSGHIFWSFAQLPSGCGESIRPPIDPPNPPDNRPITIVKNLVFCKKPNNNNPINLIFGDECQAHKYSIPEKGVYIVKNEVEIFRTDDGRIIKAFNIEIGSNSKEYLWSGSLSLPFSELERVADKPEIEININHLKFIVDIKDINTKQVFNSKNIEIQISSTTNRLKTVNAYDLGYDASSIAIMSAQLDRDDLKTGFIFNNNGGEDWIIPIDLIEYDEASALEIINGIALSVGDVVISHAHKKEIMMKAKYPEGDPVYSVPIGKLFDYATNESESIKYNAVIATGENKGITAVVRKEGTAGEKIAPMIVNKLITAENAARRAAINNIYNTDDYSIDISTESVLFKEVPMIYPRDIVQIGSDVGWVDDIQISVALDDKALTVRHIMSIEKKVA